MANNDFEIADVIGSEVEGGEVRLDVGDVVSEETYATDCQFWGTDGFYGIPAASDADGAAQALFFVDGNAKRVVGTRDNRAVEKYGSLQPGDRAIISTGDARLVLKNEANSLTMYTELGPTGSKDAVMIDVRGDASGGSMIIKCGKSTIAMKQGVGPQAGEITLGNGLGGITIDALGNIIISGASVRVKGGTVLIGGATAEIALPGVNNAIVGATGVTGVPSTSVFIGV